MRPTLTELDERVPRLVREWLEVDTPPPHRRQHRLEQRPPRSGSTDRFRRALDESRFGALCRNARN